ncbi:MAG: DEAD/DEAH box helicase [Gammaproteobacteria bacterium]|nr:DEAD/DEAH box helicase [Gammaproteobacteria bacterium]
MEMRWLIRNNAIVLSTMENSIVPIDAKSIYLSIFSAQPITYASEAAPDIREQLPQLTFSRYPATPCISVNLDKGSNINVSIIIDAENKSMPILPGIDQLIVGEKWFPIDKEAFDEITDLLSKNLIPINSPITLGQLIKLRRIANEIGLIEDPFISFDDPKNKPVKACSEIPGLNAELYPYQKDGASFLKLIADESIGCILADEMGLGKTLQVIALLQLEYLEGRSQSLIVMPATLLENWRRELLHFSPDISVFVHAGMSRPGIVDKLKGYDVVLVSYETAIRDEPLLASIEWNILVLDEAQNIKNPEAQRTIVVKKLPRRVSVAVTGTPMENKLEDLWSLADFALPGLLGDLGGFQKEYENVNEDAGRLAPIIAPVILRRHVDDVAKDLPDKIEIPQPIIMSKVLAEAYEALRKETLEEYGRAASLVATTKLRVLCAHPRLSIDWSSDPCYEMAKYQRTLEIFEEIFTKKEKVLLFTTYQGMVDLFMQDMPKRWSDVYINFIDGRVSVEKRQPIVDDFFNHNGAGVLFLNPKAAGAGLNITAANHVIHYNPEWNPALTEQASRRSYRRKQNKPVTIHHLFFVDTLEEVIMERAQYKRQLAANAVTGHDGKVSTSVIAEALEISPIKSILKE